MKVLKAIAASLALLALLAGALFAGAVWLGERKRARTVEVRVVPVPFTRDAAAIKAGKYLYESRGCAECHGADGAGRVMLDEPNGLFVRTPGVASGAGSATSGYTEADWVRVIRHGVSPRGRPLLIMPSVDYNRLTDIDVAALVAYMKSLPAVAAHPAEVRLPAFVKAAYGAGLLKDSAEKIDHRLPPALPVAAAVSIEHGAYVAAMCSGCHGATLAGGPIPGAPPDWPAAANLTPGAGGVMERYDTPEKFTGMMRTGRRPDGTEVSRIMPFASLAKMNDVDLLAAYAYLATLAPRKTGER